MSQKVLPSRATLEAVKTVALATGVRIDPEQIAGLGGAEALTVHEYATTGGITLALPADVLVNAPFDAGWSATSPLRLEDRGEGWALVLDGVPDVPVEAVLPLPGYLDALDAAGERVSEVAMSHADRIRVSPISGCAYDCSFCDVAPLRYQQHPVDRILRAIDVARRDARLPTRHLLISGGSPSIAHAAGQEYFLDLCRRVAAHVLAMPGPTGEPFEVDVMMSARPDGPEFVSRLVDTGVTGFSLNIELYGDEYAGRHLPLKHRRSREHLEPMIERAVECLGAGTGQVRSLIIPGLEPLESTLAGVEWLASLGASPVLSPFRPAPGTALEYAEPVTAELLTEVLHGSREIAQRFGVPLGPRCVACQHNTLAFPWDVM